MVQRFALSRYRRGRWVAGLAIALCDRKSVDLIGQILDKSRLLRTSVTVLIVNWICDLGAAVPF